MSGAPSFVTACVSMCGAVMTHETTAASAAVHVHHDSSEAVAAAPEPSALAVAADCRWCCPDTSSTAMAATTTARGEAHGLLSAPVDAPGETAVTMARPPRVARVRVPVFPPAPPRASLVLRI